MGSFGDYLEKNALKFFLNGTQSFNPPTTLSLALGTAAANESDDTSWGGELTQNNAPGYSRQTILFRDPQTDAAGVSSIKNNGDITFPFTGTINVAITSFSIWDQSLGKMLAYGDFPSAINVQGDDLQLRVKTDEVTLKLQGWSTYFQDKLLRHVFRNQAYTRTDLYVALFCGSPTFPGNEVVGGGYARVQQNTWNIQSTQENESHVSVNDAKITFPQANAPWTDPNGIPVNHFAIFDAQNGGNLLFAGTLSNPSHITTGDIPFINNTGTDLLKILLN
jgi:hypothetical protein